MTEVSPRPGPKPPEMRTRRGPRGRAASIYKWWSPLEVTDAAAYGVRDCRCARADLVRPRRRGGVVAGLHLPLARLRVRGRRDRARRSEGAPTPPPRRDGRRGSRASQGGAVASGSGEVARRRPRGDPAAASRGAPAGARSLNRSAPAFTRLPPP